MSFQLNNEKKIYKSDKTMSKHLIVYFGTFDKLKFVKLLYDDDLTCVI